MRSSIMKLQVAAALAVCSVLLFGVSEAKTVALVDNFNDAFTNNCEGWVRASGVPADNIQVGGNMTTGLGRVASGDELIVCVHSSNPTGNDGSGFVWGGTTYTGFGSGEGQMGVPDGFGGLVTVTVKFVSCFSGTDPDGDGADKPLLTKLLDAMGGGGGDNHGTGYRGVARANVNFRVSGGNADQRRAAIRCAETDGAWMRNPPANRPGTGGNDQPGNQQTAGQALINNCEGVPPRTLTFSIPNQIATDNRTAGYMEPIDQGALLARMEDVSVCGDGIATGIADEDGTPVLTTTWGKIKAMYK